MLGDDNRVRSRQPLAFHKLVPNMLTLTAMCAGLTSIQFAIAGRWEASIIAIVIAAFIDGFDGAAARLLKASSKLGAELDSLSDFLCFGVAPAIVLHLWMLREAGRLGWIASLIFCVAVALRLARYNSMQDEPPPEKTPLNEFFVGVPSPVGAGLGILPMIVSFLAADEGYTAIITAKPLVLWCLFISVLMISRIPTYSSKQLHLPQKLVILALAAFALLLGMLISAPWPTLTLMGIAYLVMIPVSFTHHMRLEKKLKTG